MFFHNKHRKYLWVRKKNIVGCQKRFSVPTDSQGQVRCPDYSRDLSIKDNDIEEAVKKDQQA